nr:MAG TPA: hypothetical protein [Bacteriophage sp.]
MMNEYMNEPVERVWMPEDVVNTYQKLQDKTAVAKIYCIPVKQVTKILSDNK